MDRSWPPGSGERFVDGRRAAGEEQPRRQRGSRVHNFAVVVVFVSCSLAHGRTVAVAGGAWRPARGARRGCARDAAFGHGTLRSTVGRRVQDVPVYGARLRSRGDPGSARDPAFGTGNGARAWAGLRG